MLSNKLNNCLNIIVFIIYIFLERPSCECCDQCTYNRTQPHERYWQQFQGAANKVTLLYRGKLIVLSFYAVC